MRKTALPRHPGDAIRVVLAVAAIALTAAFVHRDRLTVLEGDVFRVFNDLPAWMFPALWIVMQLGNFVAVPLVAAAAGLTRRFRLAAEIGLTGTGVWLLAKEVKKLVVRGRPEHFLHGIHIHGAAATGLGYPSGHAAVVAATATLIIPYLGRGWRRGVASGIVIVGVARVYVGAHLPLDVVAGAALGWGVASAVHLVLGAPSGRPRTADVRRSLGDLGFPPISITALGLDARRSALFRVAVVDDRQLFVKVIPRERRDWDWPYRVWARATRRRDGPGPRSPREAVEREALMTMMAARAGVRVPEVAAMGVSRHGAGVMVLEWVDGRELDVALSDGDTAVRRRVLADAWHQVATLQDGRIAHGALTGQHLMVDNKGRVHVVAFGDARTACDDLDLLADVADVLWETVAALGAEETVAAARSCIGNDRLLAAVEMLGARRRRWKAGLILRGRRDPGLAVGLDALRSALEDPATPAGVARPG